MSEFSRKLDNLCNFKIKPHVENLVEMINQSNPRFLFSEGDEASESLIGIIFSTDDEFNEQSMYPEWVSTTKQAMDFVDNNLDVYFEILTNMNIYVADVKELPWIVNVWIRTIGTAILRSVVKNKWKQEASKSLKLKLSNNDFHLIKEILDYI